MDAVANTSRVSCGLAGFASVSLDVATVTALRSHPGPPCDEPLPVSTLKHLDEQTLTALVAIARARQTWQVSGPFTHWGLVAAPRYLGRATAGPSLARFFSEGAWGVSPHIVPHRSLHSLSGTASQVLHLQGPNLGVGGSPGCEAEALLAALTLLRHDSLPGIWLLLSRIEPELPPCDNRPHPHAQCQAIALALVPNLASAPAGQLEFYLQASDSWPPFSFDLLLSWWQGGEEPLLASLLSVGQIRLVKGQPLPVWPIPGSVPVDGQVRS